MTHHVRPHWRGARGEWYVAIQIVLLGIVFLAPRTFPGWPLWPALVAVVARVAGVALLVAGSCLAVAGAVRLGGNLTPLPSPKEGATLVQTGPYRFVRHPLYTSLVLLSYGWALAVQGSLTLIYATVLLIFLDIKATREERWLVARFPAYASYRRRVRKFIPFLY